MTATLDRPIATIVCDQCKVEKATRPTPKGIRLPMGWHRGSEEQPICGKCWATSYVVRAVTIPVAEPMDATKDEMWEALRKCWQASTAAANLAVAELFKAEPVRKPGDEKCPPMPRTYLYGVIPPSLAGMDPVSHTCLLTAVERKWRKTRFDIIWCRKAALPVYRYPMPYPVPHTNWEAERTQDGASLVKCRFAGRWWTLRLRSGKGLHGPIAQHRMIADGQAIGTELSLLPDKDGKKLMCKMVAWFPRRPRDLISTIVATAKTTGDAFLVVTIGDRIWRLNGDGIRNKILNYNDLRQRSAEDLKFEKRWPKDVRRLMLEDQRSLAQVEHNRLSDWIGTSTKSVVGYVKRQGVRSLILDLTDKSYLESFPWFRWTETLRYKLDAEKITLQMVRESEGDEEGSKACSQETQAETAK